MEETKSTTKPFIKSMSVYSWRPPEKLKNGSLFRRQFEKLLSTAPIVSIVAKNIDEANLYISNRFYGGRDLPYFDKGVRKENSSIIVNDLTMFEAKRDYVRDMSLEHDRKLHYKIQQQKLAKEGQRIEVESKIREDIMQKIYQRLISRREENYRKQMASEGKCWAQAVYVDSIQPIAVTKKWGGTYIKGKESPYARFRATAIGKNFVVEDISKIVTGSLAIVFYPGVYLEKVLKKCFIRYAGPLFSPVRTLLPSNEYTQPTRVESTLMYGIVSDGLLVNTSWLWTYVCGYQRSPLLNKLKECQVILDPLTEIVTDYVLCLTVDDDLTQLFDVSGILKTKELSYGEWSIARKIDNDFPFYGKSSVAMKVINSELTTMLDNDEFINSLMDTVVDPTWRCYI